MKVKQKKSSYLSHFWSKNKHHLSLQNTVWISLFVVLISSTLSQVNIRQSRLWINHSINILEKIQQAEFSLLSAQSELQKFFIEQNSLSLIQYREQIEETENILKNLIELTSDNATQQQRLNNLRDVLQQRNQQKNQILEEMTSSGSLSIEKSQLIIFDNTIRQLIEDVREEEKSLLQQRREKTNFLGTVSSSIVVLGLALIVLLSLLIRRTQTQQKKIAAELNQQLSAVELQQELSSHLLTCRKFDEAYDILQSLWTYLLPDSFTVLYQINNSRDQMMPTVVFGNPASASSSSPRDCWALRRGEAQTKQHKTFILPCTLCKQLHPKGIPSEMMCFPLQAHEQTIGILHLESVPSHLQGVITALIPQIALPLAVLHLQSELEYLSFHDANTGIYNRRFLDEMISRAIANGQRLNYQVSDEASLYSVGIIFLDVDYFKKFNSEYGHEAGDKVLRILGGLLKDITRAGEDTACRYGGEEFVLVMPGASEQETFSKAEFIREAIQKQAAPGGQTITVSLGVATYPKNGTTAEEVLRAANVALLKAKGQGRNQTIIAG